VLWFLSYPRGIIVSLFAGFQTIFVSAMVLLLCFLNVSKARVNSVIRYAWARSVIWLSGASVEVRGAEHMPVKGCIVLFNHTSYIDIFTLYGYFPRDIHFGAKIELFRIPFFGRAMRAMGAIPINRKMKAQVLKLYEAAIPRLADGEAFALAPEGTRQHEHKIGKFKVGPFLFGMQAHVALVPTVIAGAFDVLPRNSLWLNVGRWRRKIIMEILPPVDTEGLPESELDKVQERIHAQMDTTLERLKSELLMAQTTLVKNL
jgi:1-acyl-sn-glycerol-3-phosphate acyltransferase